MGSSIKSSSPWNNCLGVFSRSSFRNNIRDLLVEAEQAETAYWESVSVMCMIGCSTSTMVWSTCYVFPISAVGSSLPFVPYGIISSAHVSSTFSHRERRPIFPTELGKCPVLVVSFPTFWIRQHYLKWGPRLASAWLLSMLQH